MPKDIDSRLVSNGQISVHDQLINSVNLGTSITVNLNPTLEASQADSYR